MEDELRALRILSKHLKECCPDHLGVGTELFWGPLEAVAGVDLLEQASRTFAFKAAVICFIAIDLEPPGARTSVAASLLEEQGADRSLGVRRALQALADSHVALYEVERAAPNGHLVLSPVAGGPRLEVTDDEHGYWSPGDLATARIVGPTGGARMIGDRHGFPATFRDELLKRTAQQKLDSRMACQLWLESRLGSEVAGIGLNEAGIEIWLVSFTVHDPTAVERAFADRGDELQTRGPGSWTWTEIDENESHTVVITLEQGVLIGGAPTEATARRFRRFVEGAVGKAVTHKRTRCRNPTQEAHEKEATHAPRAGLLERRSRYPHLTADLRHYLDDEDLSIRIPREARAIGLYLGRIVAAVSAAPREQLFDIDVTCRRRPGNRPCGPQLVARLEVDERIQWQCPGCGDAGTISGWVGSAFDQRDREAIEAQGTGPGSSTRVFVMLAVDYRRLLGLVHLTAPALRLLMSVHETDEGKCRLLGTAEELVDLARCITFHFARSRRLSEAADIALSELHHGLALYGDAIPDTSAAAQCAEVLLFERSRRAGPRPDADPEAGTYRLDVRLQDIAPPVWRRLEVPGDSTLEDLYEALILAFGWSDTHLHRFAQGEREFGRPHPDDFRPLTDERSVRICDVLQAPGETMVWEYDFGDSWLHDIVVEKILDTPAPLHLVAGARAAPPEDCGGAPGYENLIEVLRDAFHEEHASLREWSDDFDPESFDLAMFAERVARMTPARDGTAVVEV